MTTNLKQHVTRAEFKALVCFIGLAWYLGIWVIGLLGVRTARRYRNRPRSPVSSAVSSTIPGVSILRPLKGLDTNLYENLESTFQQEYSNFEILLSVADPNDQALPVVRDLISKYSNVPARLIIGDEHVGVNPKVNNLVRSYREAANDILWVLDSNVMVAPGTLARSIDALMAPQKPGTRRIALVHHVPFAFAHDGHFGSRIEEAFLNTNHAKMYLAINAAGVDSCVVGKSNLYRRSDLEKVNGFLKPLPEGEVQASECGLPAFGRFLAEDNMIASALWHELGYRHDLSCDVAHNALGHMSVADYIYRRVRWIRVRKHMALIATFLEPLTECLIHSLIGYSSLRYLYPIPFWIFIVAHLGVWLFLDLDVYTSLAGHPLPPSARWGFLAAWVSREVLALPIWLLAMFGNEVEWRGKTYHVMRHGEVSRVARRRSFLPWFSWSKQDEGYEQLEVQPA